MTSRSYRYRVVDVFTKQPLEGNPLGVFPDSDGLDGVTMQRIAKELMVPETVFVVPKTRSDCAAAVRIFTPAREMPFAGHPTVGVSFVLLDEGIVPRDTDRFTLEEKIGPIAIRVENTDGRLIWLTTPPITYGRLHDGAVCARVLGLEADRLLDAQPQLVSAGNPTLLIAVKSREDVDRAWVDAAAFQSIKQDEPDPFCIFVFTPTTEGAYSRMFAPEYGIVEDPATGSSTGPLAGFMMRNGLLPAHSGGRFVSEQGTKMGRRSLLHIEIHGDHGVDGIAVGGHVTPIVEAVMKL